MKDIAKVGKILSSLLTLVVLTALFTGCKDERNDPEFCFQCGVRCVERRTPHEIEAGVGWFLRAANMGHAVSQRVVGYYLIQGYGVPQDVESGIYWLKLAASQGDSVAQEWLNELAAANSRNNALGAPNGNYYSTVPVANRQFASGNSTVPASYQPAFLSAPPMKDFTYPSEERTWEELPANGVFLPGNQYDRSF